MDYRQGSGSITGHPLGSIETLLDASSSRLGIPRQATVASLYKNGSWRLPPAHSDPQLQLREQHDEVDWANVVWTSYGIPRHNFRTWLVVLDRCPNRDRLFRWGLHVHAPCLLCNRSPESRNHLYFECDFAYNLWMNITRLCSLNPTHTWPDSIQQMIALPAHCSSRPHRFLSLLAWQSTIYWIWNERNTSLHSNTFRSTDLLFRSVDLQIRNRIQSFRESKPKLCSSMMQTWIRLA